VCAVGSSADALVRDLVGVVGTAHPTGFGRFFNTGQTRPDRGRDFNRGRSRYRNRNRRTKDGIWTRETGYTVREDQPQFTAGIDPDPDSDPDTDGNQEQTDRDDLYVFST
jgi:hypothetical protein